MAKNIKRKRLGRRISRERKSKMLVQEVALIGNNTDELRHAC